MSFLPIAPTRRCEPLEVAPETYLIREAQDALGQPLSVYLNSVVIRGAEPVLIDTGTVRNRKVWLEDVFALVDPDDVRWVFLSHDDADHTGNLTEVMTACPNATLVSSWAITERYASAFEFPLERSRWINDGESFDVGDRTLEAIRPPTYDSPTTRGLLDRKTGVYWAADSFATPVPGGDGGAELPGDVGDLDRDFWWNGMVMFGLHALSPWLTMVDSARFGAAVDRLQRLEASTILAAHSPAILGDRIDEVLALTRRLPDAELPPVPDQVVLEHLLAASAQAPTPVPS